MKYEFNLSLVKYDPKLEEFIKYYSDKISQNLYNRMFAGYVAPATSFLIEKELEMKIGDIITFNFNDKFIRGKVIKFYSQFNIVYYFDLDTMVEMCYFSDKITNLKIVSSIPIKTYSLGQRFKYKPTGEEYILCVGNQRHSIKLINLSNGSQWSQEIVINDYGKITEDEIKRIMNVCFDGFRSFILL